MNQIIHRQGARNLLFLATVVLCLSLITGFRWESSSPSSVLCIRGGARPNPRDSSFHDHGGDDENDHFEPRRRSPKTNQHRQPSSSLLKRVAKGSAKLTGQALSATARTSGKMAYSLVSPKHVVWKELVGLWRLDQWMNDDNRSLQSTIELTPRPGQILIPGPNKHTNNQNNPRGKNNKLRVDGQFTPSKWPLSARIEFTHPVDQLLYTCTVHRKLADTKVLKLRGKIYARKWGRKVLVGTFVGRRRLKLLMDDDDNDDATVMDDEDDDDSEFDPDEELSDEEEGGTWDILRDARSMNMEEDSDGELGEDGHDDDLPFSDDDDEEDDGFERQ